jgi:hypothetical protein
MDRVSDAGVCFCGYLFSSSIVKPIFCNIIICSVGNVPSGEVHALTARPPSKAGSTRDFAERHGLPVGVSDVGHGTQSGVCTGSSLSITSTLAAGYALRRYVPPNRWLSLYSYII